MSPRVARAPDARLSRRAMLRLGYRGAVLGALLFAGCGLDGDGEAPTPMSTAPLPPTTTPAPLSTVELPTGPETPNDIVLKVAGEVPEDQVILVRYAAELARDVYYRRLGFHVDGPVEITLVNLPDLPLHAVTFLREGARISAITVNVGEVTWGRETPAERTKVVAHEYFHVIQNWLRGGADSVADPMFLVEGSAEYAGYLAAIEAGLISWSEVRGGLVDRIRRQGVRLPPLDRLTDEGPLALTGYGLAALAVDRLAGAAGLVPLAKYVMLRRDVSPTEAFEALFGRSLGAFYADFALWRQTKRI